MKGVTDQCTLDPEGRHISCHCKVVFCWNLTIIGVYASNVGQQRFWEDLTSAIGNGDQKVLLMGDFNSVLDPVLDLSNVNYSILGLFLRNF